MDTDEIYYARFTFRFTISPSRQVQGSGKGEYTGASWTRSGRNGDKHLISCSPELTAAPFKVRVAGHILDSGGILLDLQLLNPEEWSVDTPCGGDYIVNGGRSTELAGSFQTVLDGSCCVEFRKGQYSRSLSKHEEYHTTGGDGVRDDDWTITIEPGPPRFTKEQKEHFAEQASVFNIEAAGGALIAAGCLAAPDVTATKACAIVMGIASAGWWLTSAIYSDLALDPPDDRFRVIARPKAPRFPDVAGVEGLSGPAAGALQRLFANISRAIGLGRALVTSVERASGAAVAGNETWQRKQMRAARRYAAQLAAAMDAQVPRLTQARNALESGGFGVFTFSASDVEDFQRRVRAEGLPGPLVDTLRRLGAGPGLREQFGDAATSVDPDRVAALGGLPAMLTDPSFMQTIRATAKALRAFSRSGS